MIKNFILDVDGCLNDGKIYWGAEGKPFKAGVGFESFKQWYRNWYDLADDYKK